MAWGRGKTKQEQEKATNTGVAGRGPVQQGTSNTVLGPTLKIEGEVRSDKGMLVLGHIKGKVFCEDELVIGDSGHVEGGIQCKTLRVDGRIDGDVNASEQISISASGKLIGDITTKRFVNQPGGYFEGYSHMARDKDKKSAPTGESKQTQKKEKTS